MYNYFKRGSDVREKRRQMGMTQEAFASLLGVPRVWLSRIENKESVPVEARELIKNKTEGI
jgi:transcriptional regulator with XRE-family HTH domain